MKDHPEDVFAKTGYAEVLKAQHRLPQALEAYDAAMKDHPEDVVPKNGYAEVLKALNKLPEALKAYKAAMKDYPEDVVSKNGYAEVLKALNRLPEALKAYEAVLKDHPEDEFAINGCACLLAAMDRSQEALSLLHAESPNTVGEWVGYHIRGMINLRNGNTQTAIEVFQHGIANNPRPVSREYFQSALAVAYMRAREYERASRALEAVCSFELQTVGNILRVHTFGQLGDSEHAKEAYNQLSDNPEPLLIDLQEELYQQYVLYEPANHDEAWLLDKETDYLLLGIAA